MLLIMEIGETMCAEDDEKACFDSSLGFNSISHSLDWLDEYFGSPRVMWEPESAIVANGGVVRGNDITPRSDYYRLYDISSKPGSVETHVELVLNKLLKVSSAYIMECKVESFLRFAIDARVISGIELDSGVVENLSKYNCAVQLYFYHNLGK